MGDVKAVEQERHREKTVREPSKTSLGGNGERQRISKKGYSGPECPLLQARGGSSTSLLTTTTFKLLPILEAVDRHHPSVKAKDLTAACLLMNSSRVWELRLCERLRPRRPRKHQVCED